MIYAVALQDTFDQKMSHLAACVRGAASFRVYGISYGMRALPDVSMDGNAMELGL